MKCKRIQEKIGAYLYGDLAPDEMREVRLHTQSCAACKEDVESRGKVLAAIPSAAPELSDDERTQIAWAVKGAIRNGAQAREGFRWGYVAAAASVALAGMAVAAIVIYNSSKPGTTQGGPNSTSPAVVSIQEERPAPAKKPRTAPPKPRLQAQEAPVPTASPVEEERTPSEHRAPDIRRQLTPFVAVTRHEEHKRHVAVDKPAAIIEKPELNEPAPPKEGEKLPKPTGPNDAQTVP
jgi:hypothetical protein